MDRNDGRVLQGVEVAELGAEAAALVAQGADEALHVQQGKATAFDDLVRLAVAQQALHHLAFFQVAAQVVVQQAGQRGRAATVVVGLADDVAELQLAHRLDHRRLSIGPVGG
ncbi:hypothetical protein FQZ97_1159890 [compost metagenome]